jgi:nickel transport protein
MKRLILIVVLNTLPLPALAHKVIASVFPSGKAIEGEIGLSNGEMATGQTVEILGPDGTLLGETVTDEDGFFLFVPSQPVAHRFRADMGAGHVADVTMPAAEVAEILGVAAPAPAPARAVATNLTASAPGLTDSDRS